MSAPATTSRNGSFRERGERVVVVTQVAESHSEDLSRRTRNYLIAMGIRTLCFVSLLIVPGWWRLLPLGLATVLPVVAVMVANAIDHRRPDPVMVDDEPGPLSLPPGEVIKAEVVED